MLPLGKQGIPMQTVDVGLGGSPLLDLRSFARHGPGRRDRLSTAEIEHIALTVRRAPEVMIKVLPRGTQSLPAIARHLSYIDRNGKVPLETDDGERLAGIGSEKALMENWDLDIDTHRRRSELAATNKRHPPKLVHKLLFSMPAGTPPDKVLAAVRNFAREEFALKHRYAMALHTDEPHPHVHMVVKAVSEQGVRLHIRKATLRDWRREFARQLRKQGVAANATERAVRGEPRSPKMDGIYRATLRGESTHTRARMRSVVAGLAAGTRRAEPGQSRLTATRKEVVTGWDAVSSVLVSQGEKELASQVRRFAAQMPIPQTDAQVIEAQLRSRIRDNRVRTPHSTR